MAFTKCEWNEDVWKGASTGCTVLVAFFNLVAEEVGREKAVEMLRKLGSGMGAQEGDMCKQQLGGQKLDVKKLSELVINASADFGDQMEIEYEDDSFKLKIYNCPLGGAYKALGMDLEAGKKICDHFGGSYCESFMKVLAPGGKYEVVRFRENWDDYCEERYSLGEGEE